MVEHKSNMEPKKIYVGQSKVDGNGILAAKDIRAGELISFISCPQVKKEVRSKKDSFSIANWIGAGKYLWLNTNNTEFRYLNHSCNPNAAIVSKRKMSAMRNIKENEEIFIDYSLTDVDKFWEMKCLCKEKNCREIIRPIFDLPKSVFARHFPNIPKYFQHVFFRHYIKKQGSKTIRNND